MKQQIKRLVCKAQFATAGQKQVFIMLASYSNDRGEFSLAYDEIERRVKRKRSSISEDHRLALDVGLIEKMPSRRKGLGHVPRYRWIVATLQKLANGEAELLPCRVPLVDPLGQPRQVCGVTRTRKTCRLVDRKTEAGGPVHQSKTAVQILDHAISNDPNSGSEPSRNRNLIKEDKYNNSNSLSVAAHERQTSPPVWGEWEEVRHPVRILERTHDKAHVAAFIHLVRKRLGPPQHFSAEMFDVWMDELSAIPPEILTRLAHQQLRDRTHRIDTLQVLLRSAARLHTADQTRTPTGTPLSARQVTGSKQVSLAQDYRLPEGTPLERQEIDWLVWKNLGRFASHSFRQLRSEGVKGGVATFSGNGVPIDEIDKNHRGAFEQIVRLCFPAARQVEFKRDRIC